MTAEHLYYFHFDHRPRRLQCSFDWRYCISTSFAAASVHDCPDDLLDFAEHLSDPAACHFRHRLADCQHQQFHPHFVDVAAVGFDAAIGFYFSNLQKKIDKLSRVCINFKCIHNYSPRTCRINLAMKPRYSSFEFALANT